MTTIIFNFHDNRYECDRTFYKTVREVNQEVIENLRASAFNSVGVLLDAEISQESVTFKELGN